MWNGESTDYCVYWYRSSIPEQSWLEKQGWCKSTVVLWISNGMSYIQSSFFFKSKLLLASANS